MPTRDTIVLYNPAAESFALPLGILAIATYLRDRGLRFRILDGRLGDDPLAVVGAEPERILLFGCSVLTGAPILPCVRASRAVKLRYPDIPVVWGGWHPSILPEQCLRAGACDAVVRNQGEESFAELVERLISGRDLEGCAGISFVGPEQSIVSNPDRAFSDVNGFPPMDYGLIDPERYFRFKGKRQLDYVASQGCPFRCAFCSDPKLFGGRWAGLKAERVVAEVVELARRYRLGEVFFNDDLFFTSPKRLEAICDGLIAAGRPLSWLAEARADLLDRVGDALLDKVRASGCRKLTIGAESGSQRSLDAMHKKTLVEQVERCAERLTRHGILAQYSFIAGFPDETDADRRETIQLIRRIKKIHGRIDTPIFYFTPYPGTALTDRLVELGVELPEKLEDWACFELGQAQLPWMDPGFVERVGAWNYYLERGYRRPYEPHNPLAWILAGLARLRSELGYYDHPWEMRWAQARARRTLDDPCPGGKY